MAKRNNVSAFDEILEKFSDEGDRTTFQGLAERYPEIKDGLLRQSDYSRRMSEIDNSIKELDSWKQWGAENWDADRKMTKREAEQAQKLEELTSEKERLAQLIEFGGLGGDDMNFDELEKWGKTFTDKQGFVTASTVQAEKTNLERRMDAKDAFIASAAGSLAYLTLKHEKEFGEILDPQPLLEAANEKNALNLREFYEKDWVVEARQKKMADSHAAEIKRLQEQSAQEVAKIKQEADERLARMAPSPSGSPTDGGEGSMSAMQRHMLGIKDDKDPKIPEGPIGGGSAAAAAAAQYRETGSV